jgi:hypothetical protein
MFRDLSRQPNFVVLVVIAWALIVAQLLAANWAVSLTTLHDADDAMRLVQVRAFLAGQGWFDLHEPRLGLPPGYGSHWSRLVDAGIAGLYLLFAPFAGGALAERLTVTIWPMLWVLPMLAGVAAIAWRLGGREAAILVLLLAVFDIPGLQHFRPTRIDHHNVQMALAMLAVAATVWSDRYRWAAPVAGATSGFAVGIGLEALHFHALCGAALALHFVADRSAAAQLRAYGLALALAVGVAFLLNVAPDHWARSVCDAIAINLTAAVLIAGTGMALVASRFADERRTIRAAAVAAVAVLALLEFALFNPRCLAGPYAMVDPAIRPIWLADVAEDQTLFRMLADATSNAIAIAAYPAAALAAALMCLQAHERARRFATLVAGVTALIAVASFVAAIRNYSYAIWFGLPLVAVAALHLFERLKLHRPVQRFLAALLATPTVLTLGAITIASAAGTGAPVDLNSPERQACVRRDNFAPLARLPAGLAVVNELEWGPYLLAFTPHSVLAAPYHRLAEAILASHRVFASPPEEAHRLLQRIGVSYVVTCGTRGAVGLGGAERFASLWGHLQGGAVPDWLELLSSAGEPIAIYRVRR